MLEAYTNCATWKEAMKSWDDWERLGRRRLKRLIDLAQASPALRKIAAEVALPWEADLRLVNSLTSLKLNQKYRGKKTDTDILSFPAPHVFRSNRGYLGELVVCYSVLDRQATEFGTGLGGELDLLLAHGLLHLLGMDHEKSTSEEKRMKLWEAKLLTKLGQAQATGLIKRSRLR